MLTLLPAVLVLLGRRVFWPLVPAYGSTPKVRRSLFAAMGTSAGRRPLTVLAAGAVLLGTLALGALNLPGTVKQQDSFVDKPESVTALETLAKAYPEGSALPIDVLTPAGRADAALAAIRGVEGVGYARKGRTGGGWTEISVTASAPPQSAAETATIERLRDRLDGSYVGGASAQQIDLEDTNARDRLIVVPLVLLSVLLILVALLRSLVAPPSAWWASPVSRNAVRTRRDHRVLTNSWNSASSSACISTLLALQTTTCAKSVARRSRPGSNGPMVREAASEPGREQEREPEREQGERTHRDAWAWQPGQPGVLLLPSGRLVRGRGLRRPLDPTAPSPSYGLYLLGSPPPPVPWEARWIRWPDFRLPADRADARAALVEAWRRAENVGVPPREGVRAWGRVEVACGGGRGRTGTALACLAVLDGVPADEAVAFVRRHYDRHAVETPWQRRYVRKFTRDDTAGDTESGVTG